MNEPIKTEKKPWQTPELMVLVRSKPEEAVLQQCKTGTHAPPASFPGTTNLNCEGTLCAICSAAKPS